MIYSAAHCHLVSVVLGNITCIYQQFCIDVWYTVYQHSLYGWSTVHSKRDSTFVYYTVIMLYLVDLERPFVEIRQVQSANRKL